MSSLTNILDTIDLKVGLQDALGISSYVDHPSYWHEVFSLGIPLAGGILILSLFLGFSIVVAVEGGSEEGCWGLLALLLFIAFIVPSVSKHFSVEIADGDGLTSAIEKSIPSDYVSKEVIDSFKKSGWEADCSNNKESLLCGGTKFDSVVPAHKENGEKADVTLELNYDNFLSANNVDDINMDSRIVAPGKPLSLTIDVVNTREK